ncbi:MAG: hypothetical protein O7C75_10895 [Verrucomicrobia bacterium]|nr:hypothetical protein [Verrucomicrobiota bacterium]
MKTRFALTLFCLLVALILNQSCTKTSPATGNWYRGNTHTHSLWSDGNDFPEIITEWYLDNNYDFMALSDHNILAVGEKWMSLDKVFERQDVEGPTAMEKYRARYAGTDWIETRDNNGVEEVRLKQLSEYRSRFEKPGEFLIIQAEEISAKFEEKPIHINAVNLQEVIPPVKGTSVRDVMSRNLQAISEQEKLTGEPILAHVNHPNFRWALTAEDLAHVIEEEFFEVYNGHPRINHLGDDTRPGDEKIWDIANTIRLAELNGPPLLGVATDDSQTYHGGDTSPGRGWIMVRAKKLEAGSLIEAMRKGDFYASTGIYLDELTWDNASRTLSLEIRPDSDSTFTSELIGTRTNYNAADKNSIGEVLASQEGTSVTFNVPEDMLYARVTITSSRSATNPSYEGQMMQAWTQPVGWK